MFKLVAWVHTTPLFFQLLKHILPSKGKPLAGLLSRSNTDIIVAQCYKFVNPYFASFHVLPVSKVQVIGTERMSSAEYISDSLAQFRLLRALSSIL